MLFLSREIEKWIDEGLITSKQAQSILSFEKNKKSFLSPMMLFAFVGVFSIGVGIVALIAANWHDIPNSIKLANVFSLMIAAACSAWLFQEKKPAVFELCLFLLMMLFFGAIGLIGQIYNLPSSTYKALYFWCALAFPLMFLTHKRLLGWIWSFVFTIAFCASPLFQEILDFFENLNFNAIGFSWILFTLYAVLQLVKYDFVVLKPIKQIAGVCALFLLMLPETSRSNGQELHIIFVLIFPMLIVGSAYWLKLKYALQIYVLSALFAAFSTATTEVSLFIGQISILGVLVWTAYEARNELYTRLIIFLIALRILIAYFSLFGTLTQTGIGLIMTGFFLIGTALGWYKLDRKLKVELKP